MLKKNGAFGELKEPERGLGREEGKISIFFFISLFDEAFVVERPDRDKAQTLHGDMCDDCEAHRRPFEEPFASWPGLRHAVKKKLH